MALTLDEIGNVFVALKQQYEQLKASKYLKKVSLKSELPYKHEDATIRSFVDYAAM